MGGLKLTLIIAVGVWAGMFLIPALFSIVPMILAVIGLIAIAQVLVRQGPSDEEVSEDRQPAD